MKKGTWTNIFLILVLVTGLSLLLYPSFADYWNTLHQTRAIADYTEQLAQIDTVEYEKIWQDVARYNEGILMRRNAFRLSEEEKLRYEQLLNLSGKGIMGYIEIPSIDCTSPIYHGTEDTVLQIAIGHVEWTSLPGGGAGTHCVLSGHRGLPSARLFTDLDKMGVGDVFMLNILDQTLTYQVDQVKIVEPHVTEDLLIVEGEDYCTLVTCTPYGVNSHRMLVRGTRIENLEEAKVRHVTADAVQIEPIIVAPLLAAPILLVLLVALLIPKPKKNRRKPNDA